MTGLIRAVPLALILVALLTWLLFQSRGPRGEDYVIAQRDVARVSLGEAGLRRDVLEARAGLLRDYDPLVADIDDLRRSAIDLHQWARVQASATPLLDRLLGVVAADDTALEHFKTHNALLQNSTSYFNMLDEQIVTSDADPRIVGAVAALGDSIFHLSRDPSQASRDRVTQQLAAVGALNRPTAINPAHDQIALLLAHGRVLYRLLPAVDQDLQTLFGISTYDLRQAIRASQDARRRAEEASAARFRLALYVVALILSAVLVRVGLQWRSGLRLLRQRAAVELVIAEISTAFIATSLEDYEAMFNLTLARLGEAFGADRATLHLAGIKPPARPWSRDGLDRPAGSPDDILAACVAVSGANPGEALIDVPAVAKLPQGPLRAALVTAGVGSWCGVVLITGGERTGLLAFGRNLPSPFWPHGGAGLVRAAAEIILNALQRRQAVQDRLALEARLARARRLESLGTFASGIAHNFNNVVGVVLGHAEMAAALAAPNATASYHLREIHVAAERAQELVGRILEFGTRHRAKHRILSFDTLIADSVSMLKVLLPAQVHLAVDLEVPDQFVQGDVAQLQQVLVNLVRNGEQAMPRGGTIRITVGSDRVPHERPLSHDVLRPGDYARLRVADSGSGMDGAVLAKMFQPFFTSRPAGTGLGLATIREIVDDHQGAIDVRSALGQGSVFTVWLPAAPTCDLEPAQSERGNGETVLLCSLDAATLVRDEETLAALGYEPVGFRSLEAALAAVRERPDRFDAMLFDAGELDRDSLRTLADLRRACPGRVMIVVGRTASSVSRDELAALGIHNVLQRPFRSSTLARALARGYV